jgi:soluble lytic murein transglycosylase-like protein
VRWETEVSNAVRHWGAQYGIPISPALVHAIIERESAHGLAPNYISHGGAVPEPGGHTSYGPMQVYDSTVRTLNATLDPQALATNPAIGIWYGVHYLAKLLKQFPGDTARAVAAYNAGPGNATRNAAGKFFNQPYVDAVLAFLNKNAGASIVPALVIITGAVLLLSVARSRKRAA